MAKPFGPKCNLDCKYCFYLEKERLWRKGEVYRMSSELLDVYVRKYIESQPGEIVTFAWQGGEPTLPGISFYEKVVKLQEKYANGKNICNTLQTNGTLLNEDWVRFFRDQQFLIGLSIDGPERLHDTYRQTKNGEGTWAQVMKAVCLLVKHDVQWNSLTCVHQMNIHKPLEVYRFLRGIGSKYMQFIPVVERMPNQQATEWGLSLGSPIDPKQESEFDNQSNVTKWSVKPGDYGKFLTKIFDRWVRLDVGKIFIQINDVTLGKWLNQPHGLCIFDETCGQALAMEHDGSVYSCDHYVYPSHKIGYIGNDNFSDLLETPFQSKFGKDKKDSLPKQCLECSVRKFCNGGCPKQRFVKDKYGNTGLNYLCEDYFHYFTYTIPSMYRMATLFRNGFAPSEIMKDFL